MDKKKFASALVSTAIAGTISVLFAKAAAKRLTEALNEIIVAVKD